MSTRAVTILNTFAFGVAFAAWVIFGPSARLIVDDLHLPSSFAPWIKATPILIGSVLRIPIGLLTDILGPRIVFPALLVLGAIALGLLSLVSDGQPMIVFSLALVLGILGTTFIVGMQSVSAAAPPERRGLAIGIFGAGNVGTAVTTLGLPIMIEFAGWRPAFLVYAAVLVVTAIGYVVVLKEDGTSRTSRTLISALKPLGQAKVWMLGLYYMASFGAFIAVSLELNDLYRDSYGLTTASAALLATCFTFITSLARIPGGAIADRTGAEGALFVGLLATAVSWGAVLTNPPLFVAVIFIFVSSVAMGVVMSATYKMIPDTFPEQIGAVGGIVGALGGVGGFYLPLVGSAIVAGLALPAFFVLAPVFVLNVCALGVAWATVAPWVRETTQLPVASIDATSDI